MELAIIKIVLIGAFFAALLTAACWAGEKMNEYKDYWKEEEGEDNESR